MSKSVSIVGAGLSGCEAALQLSHNGFDVNLYDTKPSSLLDVYRLPTFAELVCNNSLSSSNVNSPLGLLTAELREMESRLIHIADYCRVDDERYFSLDKKKFSLAVTEELLSHKVNIVNKTVTCLPEDDYVVMASGPLTNEQLIKDVSIKYDINEFHFSDASSIVIDITSVDFSDKNIKRITDDLYAVRISDEVFSDFCNTLRNSLNDYSSHSVDKEVTFDKCQSIERLAEKGEDALRKTRFSHPYFSGNCLLLRRENALENGFIMVGCMTTLRHLDQQRAISVLPGFGNIRIVKYGRMHRNTYFNAPKILNSFFQVKNDNLYIIGQLSGTDGYAPAISSGLTAALKIVYGDNIQPLPQDTMMGALAHYVSNDNVVDYQPMCASFSLLKTSEGTDYCKNSLTELRAYKASLARV